MKHAYLALLVFLSFLVLAGRSKNSVSAYKNNITESPPGAAMMARWTESAKNKFELLPTESVDGRGTTNDAEQLMNRAPKLAPDIAASLNEMISGYGGILIDNGWLRILGAGCKRLSRSFYDWNKGKSFQSNGESPGYLLIADDAIGGFFAINTGGIDANNINRVFYYGPNGLKWETTGLDFNHFMTFCFSGDLKDFYGDFRWKGWEEDVKKLSGNEAISCYPKLWTRAGKELKCNRNVVSVQKVWELYHHISATKNDKRAAPRTKKK